MAAAVVVSVGPAAGPPTTPLAIASTGAVGFQVDDLHMVTTTVGWAVDGVTGDVLHTAGSADSWRVADPPGRPPPGYLVPPVAFFGGRHAWAVMAGSGSSQIAVVRTADGGIRWTWGPSLEPLSGMDAGLPAGSTMAVSIVSLDFPTSQDGWLAVSLSEEAAPGEGLAGTGTGLVLYRTTDGGTAWSTELRFSPFTLHQGGLNSGCASSQIEFSSPSLGWAAGACLEQTRDGGVTWRSVSLPTPDGISAQRWLGSSCSSSPPSFTSASTGWLALDCAVPTAAGERRDVQVLYQTSDAGLRWVPRQPPGRWPQLPPKYTTPDGHDLGARAWLLGAAAPAFSGGGPGANLEALYETTDGGARWALVNPGLPASAVDFVSGSAGFAYRGCFGGVACARPMLLETESGGVGWIQLHPRLVSGRLGSPLPYR